MTLSVADYRDTSPEDGRGRRSESSPSPVFGGGVSVLR